jgi:hypothetical protein
MENPDFGSEYVGGVFFRSMMFPEFYENLLIVSEHTRGYTQI